ncbi:MAG: family 10 glycosylhydrolase [Nitrospira sp.]|nr:family 10 glycosylhydrolase [Nitrospira sp.]
MGMTNISRRSFFKIASVLTASRFFTPAPSYSQTPVQEESRAIFDEGLNWTSKAAAEIVCDRIRRAGFNVFVPCVWHGRGTAWPSSLAPWDHKLAYIPGFDPLDNLIQTAKGYDIEVHPWFTIARRDRDFLPQYYDKGTPSESFDVHRESFREFISKLVLEVIQRYPVAGVNLDYIRTGGLCSGSFCADDYHRHTGRNLLRDTAQQLLPGGHVAELLAWQEQTVTDIVRRIATGARKTNKSIVISVDAVPGHKLDESEGRNSVMWADTGLIDVIYMMHYEPAPDWHRLKALQAKMKRPEAMVVLCGNYERVGSLNPVTVPRESSLVSTLIEQGRNFQKGNGIGLYLYSMLSDEQITHLRNTVFTIAAKPRWLRMGKALPQSSREIQVQH